MLWTELDSHRHGDVLWVYDSVWYGLINDTMKFITLHMLNSLNITLLRERISVGHAAHRLSLPSAHQGTSHMTHCTAIVVPCNFCYVQNGSVSHLGLEATGKRTYSTSLEYCGN